MLYGLRPQPPQDPTMRVRMLKTMKAIPYGGSPEVVYEAGRDYDLPEWLAEAFFKGGEADPSEAHGLADLTDQMAEATRIVNKAREQGRELGEVYREDLENKRMTTQRLDKGAAVAQSGATENVAMEQKDEPAGCSAESGEGTGQDRPERRPRRSRRVHGE